MRRNKLEQLDEKEYIEETDVMFGYLHDVLDLCTDSNELVERFWKFQCDRVGILNYYYEVIDEFDRIDTRGILQSVQEYIRLPKFLIRTVLIEKEVPGTPRTLQYKVRGFKIVEKQFPHSPLIDKELDTILIFDDPYGCINYLTETFGSNGFDTELSFNYTLDLGLTDIEVN